MGNGNSLKQTRRAKKMVLLSNAKSRTTKNLRSVPGNPSLCPVEIISRQPSHQAPQQQPQQSQSLDNMQKTLELIAMVNKQQQDMHNDFINLLKILKNV